MSNYFDYFNEHPSASDSKIKAKDKYPLSYKYGYLVGIIKSAMFMNTKQEIKDALMDALDYIEKNER
jgi:hypothetical protein